MKKKTVLIYSGGLDSTVLLAHLLNEGRELYALTINYGQRHAREIESATRICGLTPALKAHRVLDLSGIKPLLAGSSQTDESVAVPHGHYTDETMKLTVVPNRNMLLLATAAAWAISLKADTIAYAAHAGDHAIYPDCRPEFVDAMQSALALADWHVLQIERPFITLTKADIVKRGSELGAFMAESWSCYEGKDKHCGRCGTCVERIEAFRLAGVVDRTQYKKD